MIYWELKKILKSKTGIIVAAIFILLCGVMAFIKPEMETQKSHRNQQYELIKDTRKAEVIAQEKLDAKIGTIKEAANNQQKDEFSKGIKEISTKKLKSMEGAMYKEVSFWKVFDYRATNTFMVFCMVVILIIVCCNTYTDEIVSTVENLILTSKNKNRTLYSKLGLGILIPTVLYGFYLAIQFIITAIQYGMPINGKLQAIRIIDNPILARDAYTIIQFIISKIIIMILILVTLGVIACLCSFITKSSIASTSAFLIIVITPKLLTIVRVIPSNVQMVLSKVNFIDLIVYFQMFAGVYYGSVKFFGMNFDLINLCIGMLAVTIVAAITLSIVSFKKVLVR
ncbi:hypothetical protein K2F40_13995 [Clostridium sp. CM028]|uniref:hypothetical protein n=1 Tax=Clostridium sp. CM028 TaxID=2851575 RepID=UPI001C6E70A4|nr:hypothetical protein [Clostridium sp. CM028]MBW9150070.1 hypothetical protein [Clostridium sp. CM028]WLC60331.1 hypothetical protein KTC94_08885 [Clostridium sp. CM028]